MKDDVFKELLASAREGGAILCGEKRPARAFAVDGSNVKRIRANEHPGMDDRQQPIESAARNQP